MLVIGLWPRAHPARTRPVELQQPDIARHPRADRPAPTDATPETRPRRGRTVVAASVPYRRVIRGSSLSNRAWPVQPAMSETYALNTTGSIDFIWYSFSRTWKIYPIGMALKEFRSAIRHLTTESRMIRAPEALRVSAAPPIISVSNSVLDQSTHSDCSEGSVSITSRASPAPTLASSSSALAQLGGIHST